jgi:hypothetical protein
MPYSIRSKRKCNEGPQDRETTRWSCSGLGGWVPTGACAGVSYAYSDYIGPRVARLMVPEQREQNDYWKGYAYQPE